MADLPSDRMIGCPRCGFVQPADTYCASCGVDMTKVPRPKTPLLKQPAVLVGIAVTVLVSSFLIIKALRTVSNSDSFLNFTRQGRAKLLPDERPHATPDRVADTQYSGSSASTQGTAEENYDTSGEASTTVSNLQAQEASSVGTAAGGEELQGKTAFADRSGEKNAGAPGSTSAPAADAMPVAFVWADASREWLTSLGIAAVGAHTVDRLDQHLREGKDGYKIADVQKQKLAPQASGASPLTIRRDDRISVLVSTQSVSPTAGISMGMDIRYGATSRSGGSTTLQIDKDTGTVIVFEANSAQPQGPSPVLFILPRWTDTEP